MNRINLVVLASGSGTTFQNFVDLIAAGALPARISLLIASRPDIKALDRAASAKIPHIIIDRRKFPPAGSAEFSQAVFDAITAAAPDLVCLAGWLCKLELPPRYAGKIMNIHPALLPSFGGQGMYGHHVHEAVLTHGCKVSGCTVHFVDNQYDAGPIIIQRTCPVMENDTPDTLAARVFEQEKIAYPEAIRLFGEGRLKNDGRVVRINQSSAAPRAQIL